MGGQKSSGWTQHKGKILHNFFSKIYNRNCVARNCTELRRIKRAWNCSIYYTCVGKIIYCLFWILFCLTAPGIVRYNNMPLIGVSFAICARKNTKAGLPICIHLKCISCCIIMPYQKIVAIRQQIILNRLYLCKISAEQYKYLLQISPE